VTGEKVAYYLISFQYKKGDDNTAWETRNEKRRDYGPDDQATTIVDS